MLDIRQVFSPRQVKESDQEQAQLGLAKDLWADRQALGGYDQRFVDGIKSLKRPNYQTQQAQSSLGRAGKTNLTGYLGSELTRGATVAGLPNTNNYMANLESAIKKGRGLQSTGVRGVNQQAQIGAQNQYGKTQRQMFGDAVASDVLGAGIAGGIGYMNGSGLNKQDQMLKDQWGLTDSVMSTLGR